MTTDTKRDTMREKIAAGERRNEERNFGDMARDARDGATSFVKEHPITTLVGGVALGILAASLLPGPGRRLRKKATARGSALAALVTELGLAYGASLIDNLGDAARTGQGKLSDVGDSLGDTARDLRREAGSLAGDASETARALTRNAGEKADRNLRDLRSRITN